MKIALIPEKMFTLANGDRQVAGMRVVSEWEGFTKLQNAAGMAIGQALAIWPSALTAHRLSRSARTGRHLCCRSSVKANCRSTCSTAFTTRDALS